ncbi:hypothetical protein MJT46_015354 [Ovis ammon polii x Ovis aries]|nr:hypothetical protein MJT46_015354 [Ovis ammon polii x Ovis aries]
MLPDPDRKQHSNDWRVMLTSRLVLSRITAAAPSRSPCLHARPFPTHSPRGSHSDVSQMPTGRWTGNLGKRYKKPQTHTTLSFFLYLDLDAEDKLPTWAQAKLEVGAKDGDEGSDIHPEAWCSGVDTYQTTKAATFTLSKRRPNGKVEAGPCSWNLPGPDIEPMSHAPAGSFLTPGPPGSPPSVLLKQQLNSKNSGCHHIERALDVRLDLILLPPTISPGSPRCPRRKEELSGPQPEGNSPETSDPSHEPGGYGDATLQVGHSVHFGSARSLIGKPGPIARDAGSGEGKQTKTSGGERIHVFLIERQSRGWAVTQDNTEQLSPPQQSKAEPKQRRKPKELSIVKPGRDRRGQMGPLKPKVTQLLELRGLRSSSRFERQVEHCPPGSCGQSQTLIPGERASEESLAMRPGQPYELTVVYAKVLWKEVSVVEPPSPRPLRAFQGEETQPPRQLQGRHDGNSPAPALQEPWANGAVVVCDSLGKLLSSARWAGGQSYRSSASQFGFPGLLR